MWAEDEAQHGEGLCGTATAEHPGEDAGEEDRRSAGCGGEDANGEDGVAEEKFAEPGLDGDDRTMVDVSPGEMAAAGEIIKLIAKVTVSDVLGPKGESELEGKLDDCEEERKTQSRSKGCIRSLRGGGLP